MNSLYDLTKSFQENWRKGPQATDIEATSAPSSCNITLFGKPICSSLGIPACPLMTSKGIQLLAPAGYGVFTYKTIRSVASSAHPWPNICYVSCAKQIGRKDLDHPLSATYQDTTPGKIAIANSFGNASYEPEIMQADIACAKKYLKDDQFFIVSVYGSEQPKRTLIQDYVYTALLAQEAGAQAIECNVSCPNIPGENPVCYNPDLLYAIVQQTVRAVDIPVIVKVGLHTHHKELQLMLINAARAGAQGICGINTIPVQVETKEHTPYFGDRIQSGLSGNPVRTLALQFIRESRNIIKQEELPLTLLATGGITKPEHIDQFFQAGANIAMSATGVMWNPYLAKIYYEQHKNQEGITHGQNNIHMQAT